ncbi:hypothetical protein ACT3OH_18160 [Vreelandella zhanjiangensis]|uniref:hypothetical protein n=1 Tax=Vreelandella zhanjiangensis TaxID=1121960 RepID=UPI00402A833C
MAKCLKHATPSEKGSQGEKLAASAQGEHSSSPVDRTTIRQMVQRQHDSLVKMSASGQNIRKRSSDYHDWLDGVFTANMTPDEKAEFYAIYSEEARALSDHLEGEPIAVSSEINALLERKRQQKKGLSTFVVGVVIIAVAVYLIYKFAKTQFV